MAASTIWANRAYFAVGNTPGSGDITVGAAVSAAFQKLGAAHDGGSFCCTFVDGDAWEVRRGCVYTHGTLTLARGTLEESSTGSALSLSAATKVMVVAPGSAHAGWDDLRFPVQGINPGGAVDAPTIDTVLTSFPGTLLFAGNVENVIAGIGQMPHGWRRASAIVPHIHWSKTSASASTVDWRLYLRVIGNPGDAPGAWSSALVPAGIVGNQANADEQLLTYWADFAMTGLEESAVLNWRLHRLGDSDAYNADARLYELDFHYEIDKPGTTTVIPV